MAFYIFFKIYLSDTYFVLSKILCFLGFFPPIVLILGDSLPRSGMTVSPIILIVLIGRSKKKPSRLINILLIWLSKSL